jgi:pullulanase/glycogen debranching enzyme
MAAAQATRPPKPAAAARPAAVPRDCDAGQTHTVLAAAVDASPAAAPSATAPPPQAVWLDRGLIRWPGADAPVAGASRYRLYHSAVAAIRARVGERVTGADGSLVLSAAAEPAGSADRFRHVGAGPVLGLAPAGDALLATLLTGQLLLVQEDDAGRVLRATATQTAGAIDDLYAAAEKVTDLGVSLAARRTAFKLWAPTAQRVALCLYDRGRGPATAVVPAQVDRLTGAWAAEQPADLSGRAYLWLVDVVVPGVGLVRNRVTDPYSLSLTDDSQRSVVVDLDAPSLKPPGWDATREPNTVAAPTDMVVYELHVRDFSIGDSSVRPAWRGKYLAFTESASDGMKHLRALAAAGLTDVHLLPVFDIASVKEVGCVTPTVPPAPPDSDAQQAAVMAQHDRDCFNWGYDPLHYTAPEGSYGTDPAAPNGPERRVLEFRRMVQALHVAGLRVGMDMVYNHTSASGQDPKSVLDRIVPGYYHRLDAAGRVERSTCCDNTATEHRMMGKLMVDSVLTWARAYRIDSFRFDLMGHQPRDRMVELKQKLREATGRNIPLIGEGWNFGEVANGARFVQASQLSLNGSGIGTFNDRLRDALRGGGAGDDGERQITAQGWINGLFVDPNETVRAQRRGEADDVAAEAALQRSADLVRAGLAGSLRDYPLQTLDGETLPLSRIRYGDQPAGYASQPAEVVNYVENHDNQTLFDALAFKLPRTTSRRDRARAQMLGAAAVAFSQGVAYFHAGIELLRSKSMDRNSYDSGDWFNRIDWTGRDNHFGSGLPPQQDNGRSWPWMKPLLADPSIKPEPADIAYARDRFRELLRIRASSVLFRLRSADEVARRLRFADTGPGQNAAMVVGLLDGRGLDGARWDQIVYAINVAPTAQKLVLPGFKGRRLVLHPALTGSPDAAASVIDAASGTLSLPPRSWAVWVGD